MNDDSKTLPEEPYDDTVTVSMTYARWGEFCDERDTLKSENERLRKRSEPKIIWVREGILAGTDKEVWWLSDKEGNMSCGCYMPTLEAWELAMKGIAKIGVSGLSDYDE